MNNNNIRYQRTKAGRGVDQVHALRFTMLASPLDINQRFTLLADEIQRRIRHHFNFEPNQEHNYLIEFEPADDRARNTRQRTVRRINSITGEFLSTIYQAMLHSQDTLDLDGFRVTVKIIGRLMRRGRAGGAARPHGALSIPAHLKNKGLGEHPQMLKEKNKGNIPSSPCGVRAILLAYDLAAQKYFKKWDEDAQSIATQIGIIGSYMVNEDFNKLLQIPQFTSNRIIIFNNYSNIQFIATGPDWHWPDEQPRNVNDSKTLYLMLDNVENHYWWVEFINKCAFRGRKPDKYTTIENCHYCFRQMPTTEFNDHLCSGIETFQCRKCKKVRKNKKSISNIISFFMTRMYSMTIWPKRTNSTNVMYAKKQHSTVPNALKLISHFVNQLALRKRNATNVTVCTELIKFMDAQTLANVVTKVAPSNSLVTKK